MKLNTDCLRVKQILEERGHRGIHSFELKTIDLHKDRYIARLHDLESKYGLVILHTREKMGNTWGTRYTLVGDSSMSFKASQVVKSVNEQTKHFLKQEFFEVKRTKGGIPKGQLSFI